MFIVEWYISGSVVLATLFLFLFIGIPVAFGMVLAGVLGLVLFANPEAVIQVANIFYRRGSEFTFIVVPLFILMAAIIANSGAAGAVFTAASRWLNRVPGSLAVSSTAAATLFSAVSGSSPATSATIGLMAVPEMSERGYNRRMAVGAVAAGGTLGILIPPSVPMIIYGIITETSIGRLFLAGIIPGLMLSLILMLYTMGWAILRPGSAPASLQVSWIERWQSLKGVWMVVLLFVLVMGSYYVGITTVVEAAALGVAGAVFVAIINRRFSFRMLGESLMQSARTSAMVLFLLGAGFFFAFVMSSLRVPQGLTAAILAMDMNVWVLIIIYSIILLVMGIIGETLSAVLILMPILFPVFMGLGVDPIWLGVLTIVNVELGAITPPVGINLFVLRGVLPKEYSMNEIMMGGLVYVPPLLLGLALVIAFPWLSTWLPEQAFG